MTRFDEVSAVLREISEVEVEITESSRLAEDLLIDSLKLIDVVVALEQELGVELSEDDLVDLTTVGELVALAS